MKKIALLILAVLFNTNVFANEKILKIGSRGPENLSWDILNPSKSISTDINMVLNNIFRGLVGFDKYGNITPDIAEKWDISIDLKKYTFKLSNVKFHNGEKVTSDDVRKSFEEIIKKGFYPSYYLRYLKGYNEFKNGQGEHLVGILTPSKDKVVFVLERPFVPFISYLASTGLTIIKHTNNKIYGTGPYEIAKFEKNKLYLNLSNYDNQSIKNIIVYFYSNPQRFVGSYLQNKTSFIFNLYPLEIKLLGEKKDNIKIHPSLTTVVLFYNSKKETFSDQHLRHSIICHFNNYKRNASRFSAPLNDYLPNGVFGYENRNLSCLGEKRYKVNNNQKATILVPKELFDNEDLDLLKKEIELHGIKVEFDIDSFGGTYYPKLVGKNYDAVIVRIFAAVNDPDFFYLAFDNFSKYNFSLQKDETMMELLKKAREEYDIKKRTNSYLLLNEYIFEQGYAMNLRQPSFSFLLKDGYRLEDSAYKYSPSFQEIIKDK